MSGLVWLVSLTGPSCNGDISAPVIVGEVEGESSDYLTLLQPSEEPPENRLWYCQKNLSCCVDVEPCGDAHSNGVAWP